MPFYTCMPTAIRATFALFLASLVILNTKTASAESAIDKGYQLLLEGTKEGIVRSTHPLVDAVNKGDTRAAFMLGLLYQFGQGYEQSDAKALNHYVWAADRGLTAAKLAAAKMLYYPRNDISLKDDERAYRYALDAMKDGSAEALGFLGSLTYRGVGTPKDEAEGLRMMYTAMEMGHFDTHHTLQLMYRDGINIVPSAKKIINGLSPIAQAGDASAQVMLANFYISGWYVEKNRDAYLKLISAAAASGNAQGQFNLCLYHRANNDFRSAFEQCSAAVKQNHIDAMIQLAEFYFNGRGVKENASAALHLVWSASMAGSTKAMRHVDFYYRKIADNKYREKLAEQRARRTQAVLSFLGKAISTGAPPKDPELTRQWDEFQKNQRRLQNQVDELSAIGWSSF